MCGFGVWIETENILLVEVGVSQVCVPRDDRLDDFACVGLAEDFQAGRAIYGWVAHGEQEPQEFQARIEELPDFAHCFVQLHDAVQFEVTGGDELIPS